MRVAESKTFLSANPGAADLFARVIKHCEASGAGNKLSTECQDGLPISVSDISKLAEKFEMAQVAEIVIKTGEEKSEAAKEKSDRIKSIRERLSQHKDIAKKYESQLADLEKGDFKPEDPKVREFAKSLLSDFQSKIKSLAESGQDTSKAAEDLRFFATQFRDLGIIDHAEFRDLFKNAPEKSGPGTEKSPVNGRTALAENFSSAGDGRTYFALGRRDGENRQFDEFVRVSPDGKSASKEIVGKYGYSITLEPLPLQTAKSAERESKAGELAAAESGKAKIENQAKFVEETFGTNGSKIPPPENPRYQEFKNAIDKIAKETGTPPDPNDPKKTLEAIKSSLKSSYAQAIEKTSKTKRELSLLEKSSENTADTEAAQREERARNAIELLDKTGISALGPKATESLLKKFGAPGCENGKPVDLEKFVTGVRSLAGEFRTFVTETLGKPENSLFDLSSDPATLKTVESPLAFEFKTLGLLKEDGSLDTQAVSKTEKTQNA